MYRSVVALSEESRYAKLFANVQIAIRHYVPYGKMKMLAAPISETAAPASNYTYDFTSLYYQVRSSQTSSLSLHCLLC